MFPRILRSLLVAFAIILLPFVAVRPANADTRTPAAIEGTFRYAGSAAERAALEAAIHKSTEGIVFFARAAARDKLREVTTPKPWTSITTDGAFVTVAAPGELPATSPADGTRVVVRGKDGTPEPPAQKIANGQVLVQVIELDGGWMQNVYTASADGSTLSIRVTLASGKLTAPLVYTLTYKR